MTPITRTDEFTQALNILDSGQNLFLTGKAGTGKSTLIRHFLATTARQVVVAAPTGIAALNVDGYTIHRLFGFNASTSLDDVTAGRYQPGWFASTLASLDTLILDEVSMVRADLFDMLVAALERFGPQPGTKFGGVQLVLVGDLFQLPPVVVEQEKSFFQTRYPTAYFFSADRFASEDFSTVALTTVFRQLGDQQLTDLLNAVREGVLMGQAREQLNARTDPDFKPPADEFWLTLAPTNRRVEAHNRHWLEQLPGEVSTHRALEDGDLSLFEPPAEREVKLKLGAQVMMVNNDVENRWVNGSVGRVTNILRGAEGLVVHVELRDGTKVEVCPHRWEVTRPVVGDGKLRREVIGTYTQFPIRLAWAITIHKSQGQTLDRLIVDLRGGAFAYGQVYVALSRCTSLTGLVLTCQIKPTDLKTDRRIVRFLRAATAPVPAARQCALSILTVGMEGHLSRPRPLEIAVAFDDGSTISTLVNPQRDLADARTNFGVAVDDVLLAPTLAEVWAAITPLLDGYTLAGVQIDDVLGLIDFELKRLGQVVRFPIGIEIPQEVLTSQDHARLNAPTALGRARAALEVLQREHLDTSTGSPFDANEQDDQHESTTDITYLLTRDVDLHPPANAAMPMLSTLMNTSKMLSGILLGNSTPHSSPKNTLDTTATHVVREIVTARLVSAAARTTGLPPLLLQRLRDLEVVLGISVVNTIMAEIASTQPNAAQILCNGARVCFTGTAIDAEGRYWERNEMNAVAAQHGLIPVDSVTKSKCDVLVVAEIGTQSGKARKAKDYGKPVISAHDFFAWVAGAD